MSLFSGADTGRFPYKSHFNLGYEKDSDIDIGKLNILNAEFMCPGDIVHMSENLLLRFQAQFAPFFTPLTATVRAWFCPLRLIEENTEWIITGSKNGKLMKDENGDEIEIPKFDRLFDYEIDSVAGSYRVKKGGVCEQIFGMPIKKGDTLTDLDYKPIKDNRIIPALYWVKAYYRIWFDYYRDENLFDYEDFDDWWSSILAQGKIGQQDLLPVNWKKDYLTSMLYAQQKGTPPVLNPFINNQMPNLYPTDIDSYVMGFSGDTPTYPTPSIKNQGKWPDGVNHYILTYDGPDWTASGSSNYNYNGGVLTNNGTVYQGLPTHTKNQGSIFGIPGSQLSGLSAGFSATELRLLFAQQKIFERLMRCGSRYTEYLMSNFGISPTDETLQRVQYLGGFKQGVVTSEVLQTGTDSDSPVGTQRGHSISAGGNSLGRFVCKEFGLLFVTMSIMPKAQYTQGINRKFCLTERFDFPNPSFQFLSEDEVLNGEVYVDTDTDSEGNYLNDKTMGFQEMYAWLKSNRDMIIGNLRDEQRYWVMPRVFSERPNLNEKFLTSIGDSAAFAQPFAVTDKPPIVMRSGNIVSAWRNFAKYGTPGLLDHY